MYRPAEEHAPEWTWQLEKRYEAAPSVAPGSFANATG
jgi:hypothetical protein